ncbi:MAG TPA: excisionase [Ramlibacter sp.]|nr:excisionase [Ramlibacter sp.]
MSAVPEKAVLPRLESAGVASWRYVTVEEASMRTGYTVTAINQKIDKGVWREGEVWVRAPDGRRLVDRDGYERWVRAGRPGDEE